MSNIFYLKYYSTSSKNEKKIRRKYVTESKEKKNENDNRKEKKNRKYNAKWQLQAIMEDT